MSFHEKSNIAMLVIMLGVYGVYFGGAALGILSADVPPEQALAATNATMIVTVAAVVVLSIVAHIVIAILKPSEADESQDERDRMIEMRGDQRGGFVLALGSFGALVLAMLGFPVWMIANAILAGLVAGEIVKAVSKLIDYRRGV